VRVSDYIGKAAIHETLGEVLVTSAPPNSKKMVNITVTQRGRGWDEAAQTYKKFFKGSFLQEDGSRSLQWGFTNTDQHGHKDQVSIDTLSLN